MSFPANLDDKTKKLLEDLARVNADYNRAINEINSFPHAQAIKILKALNKLIDLLKKLPKEAWLALYYLLRCDTERLTDLTVEQLKDLIETLKALAELERLACSAKDLLEGQDPDATDPNRPGTEEPREPGDTGEPVSNDQYKEQLDAWLARLCAELDGWPGEGTKEEICQIVKQLVDWLKQAAPLVLNALLAIFSKALLEQIEKWAENPTVPDFILRMLLKKFFELIGQKLAAALIPVLGAILALADLIKVIDLINTINSLQEAMDAMQAELICHLADQGMGWPSCGTFVFAGPDFDGYQLTKTVSTETINNNEGTWQGGGTTQGKFNKPDGSTTTTITVTLDKNKTTENGGYWNEEKGQFECPFSVNGGSVDAGATGQASVTTVNVTASNGKNTTSFRLINGVKKG